MLRGATMKNAANKQASMPKINLNETTKIRVRNVLIAAFNNSHRDSTLDIKDNEPIFSSGYVDSLQWLSFLAGLEKEFNVDISQGFFNTYKKFDSIEEIANVFDSNHKKYFRRNDNLKLAVDPLKVVKFKSKAKSKKLILRPKMTLFWIFFHRILFRILGIKYGKGLQVFGPILLRFSKNGGNIIIGSNVTIFPGVDLKVREEGKIIIHNNVYIDMNVRLLAANNAILEIGDLVRIGRDTSIIAGDNIRIGCETAISANCNIFSSEHRYGAGASVLEQEYDYAPVTIHEQCWIGANVFIKHGSILDSEVIVGTNSLVSGVFPSKGVLMGNPARIIRYRK